MMRVMGKLLLLLSLAVTLVWSGVDSHASAEVRVDSGIFFFAIGHDHDADHHATSDPSHLAHHGCHSHLSDRMDDDILVSSLPAEGFSYLSSAGYGLTGRAEGPATKPPATA